MRTRRILALAMALLLAALSAGVAAAQSADELPYRIGVDISSQIVTIFDTQTGEIVRQMLCSTGMNDVTPTGTFIMQPDRGRDRKPWYWIAKFRRYVRYASRIRGGLLFHSLPYTDRSLFALEKQAAKDFGFPASHGCVRLRWQDAQFISENCPPGTAVRIYKSGKRNESLRQLLFQECYDASKGFSYDNFLGNSSEPGALARGSKGQAVLNLQYRLRDLGILDGEMTGNYDSATVNAVRMAQYMMDEPLTGAANPDFQERIFSDDAPTAMNVALTEGMGGPNVRKLQENLAALRLYDEGELDSVYDVDVAQAVMQFQRIYGYEPDGAASPEVQKAIDYEAGQLRQTFDGAAYDFERASEKIEVARVLAASGVALREEASQKSRKLKSLREGTMVLVQERGRHWTRVRTGAESGYVINSAVAFSEQELNLLKYTSQEDGRVYTVGCSAEDFKAGGNLPSKVFAEYLAANEQTTDISSLVNYVTVDTHGEAPSLNLRQGPDAESAVLATVENGASLRVERQYAEWTQVQLDGTEGFLMNRYLSFWTGPEDALDDGGEEPPPDIALVDYALVQTDDEDGAGVYSEGSEDARLLGHLPDGTKVQALEIADGWCQIQLKGHKGWTRLEELGLVLIDDPQP